MKMECITITTELVNCEKRLFSVSKKDYKLDIWRELKRRWMIIGVLVSMTLAVLAPRVGAPGGPLRTEYVSYIPLSCIYYLAGRCATAAPPSLNVRVVAFSAAHAHVVAPVVVAVTGTWLRDAIDFRILKGALLSSVGAPCAWLSLVVARDVGASLVLLAVNYIVSLVAAPIAMFVICGRAPVPAIGPSLWSALCAFPPLTLGVLHSHIKRDPCCLKRLQRLNRLAALVLLYVDCCERTSTAGAGLYVGDVLSTLVFAMWCVSASALLCTIYTRVGLSHSQAHTIALCSVPKALHTGWESSINCVPSGLSRLPTVFLAPAQALLLAFIADCDTGECGESCSRKTGENGCLPQ